MKTVWQYGTCNNRVARRHRKHGNVQFVLWKAGEQGHKEDYWHDFGPGWAETFIPDQTLTSMNNFLDTITGLAFAAYIRLGWIGVTLVITAILSGLSWAAFCLWPFIQENIGK